MKNLKHASLDKYVIYNLLKFHFFLLNIKEVVLAQKIHVNSFIFVFPDLSYNYHLIYPIKIDMAGKIC